MLLHQYDAEFVEMRAEHVISIENETTFNDYVEWLRARGHDEVVLLSEGQANWAVVHRLRMLAAAAPALPPLHWGDPDRFGVLILAASAVRPVSSSSRLDGRRSFERFAQAGLPLPAAEREEIESVLSTAPSEVGAIRDAERWIEEVLGFRGGVTPKR